MTPSRSLRLGVVALLAGALAAPLPTTLASATEVPAPDATAATETQQTTDPGVIRLGGANRFIVASSIAANTTFPRTPVPVVYIVSGEVFPDALSASAIAGNLGGPVLLVTKNSIPDIVEVRLTALKPKKIVILGGPNTIDPSLDAQFNVYGAPVSRIEGADRYEVSAKASAGAFKQNPTDMVKTVYVASGENYPDALAGAAGTAAPENGTARGPLLLTRKGELPASVDAELQRLSPERIIVLGGPGSVSDTVLDRLRAIQPNVTRIAGEDRYSTAAQVAGKFTPGGTVVVASGQNFPDALAGGPLAINEQGPIVLVQPDAIPASVSDYLTAAKPKHIVILGGDLSVSQKVAGQLAGFIVP
ncbi:cell wall-binding repeat-containing protein [Herbiconiux sp. A18JL235]|uniref:Cell wall-binding repeat-containing protein n=1 Tax=Herbiconiux sp. A18JL235 TaxID=3152363 RepID=A0AB39BIJ8_9MICO